MKIWFEYCLLEGFLFDCDVKFGIGWYRHHKNHKWKGFTIHFYLYKWLVGFTYVNDYKAYQEKINRRYSRK